MKQKLFSFIYFKLLGWKEEVSAPFQDKCVICVAPHTSNWDLFIGKLYWGAKGRQACFMMKKDWFFFPLGTIFRAMGGIPVDRGRKTSLVEQMTERFKQTDKFNLCITPEGTRKPNPVGVHDMLGNSAERRRKFSSVRSGVCILSLSMLFLTFHMRCRVKKYCLNFFNSEKGSVGSQQGKPHIPCGSGNHAVGELQPVFLSQRNRAFPDVLFQANNDVT